MTTFDSTKASLSDLLRSHAVSPSRPPAFRMAANLIHDKAFLYHGPMSRAWERLPNA